MGKWEIRLYFSTQNMVQCLVDPEVVVKNAYYRSTAGEAVNQIITTTDTNPTTLKNPCRCYYNKADCKLIQLGDEIAFWNASADTGLTKANITWRASKMTLNDVSMNTAQFQIRMDILEMLKQKYMAEKPLTFPVSTFQIARFTGPPQTDGGKTKKNTPLSIVLCQAINNCDTLFILPYRKATEHTVCYNPNVDSLQLHAGEYGSYPSQPFSTVWTYEKENIRFVNAAMDALNVNGSELTSFNEDVITSFVPRPMLVEVTAATDGTQDAGGGCTYVEFNDATGTDITQDNTNFFIPFPFSTDDDFQGGMSSPSSNINFKLTGTWHSDNLPMSTPWVACFLIDGVVMIRPDPGSDAAKVIWSDRTVC